MAKSIRSLKKADLIEIIERQRARLSHMEAPPPRPPPAPAIPKSPATDVEAAARILWGVFQGVYLELKPMVELQHRAEILRRCREWSVLAEHEKANVHRMVQALLGV